MNFADVNTNIFNPAYAPFFRSQARFQLLGGGGGSGKSTAAAQKIIYNYLLPFRSENDWYEFQKKKYGLFEADTLIQAKRLIPSNIRPHKEKIVLIREQQNLVRHSQFEELINIINNNGLEKYIKVNKSTMSFTGTNGNEIISAGLRSGGAERLKSMNVTGFWLEEATGAAFGDLDQLETRMRQPNCPDSRIIMTYNPIHRGHWINQHFFLHKKVGTDESLSLKTIQHIQKNLFSLNTNYKDNKFLPKAFIEGLLAKEETNPNFFKIYALGEWGGSVEGLVLPNWSRVGAFPPMCDRFVYGVDKGFNHPYAIMNCTYLPLDIYDTEVINGEEVAVLQWERGNYWQEVVRERGLTTKEILAKHRDRLNKQQEVFISPEAASDKKDFTTEGFIYVKNAANAVKDGIEFLKNSPLHIVSNKENSSQHTTAELVDYKYIFDKTLGIYTELPQTLNNDCMDAGRYGSFSAFGVPQKKLIDMLVY